MPWILYLIGALWIAFGCCAVLYTDETRTTLSKWIEKSPPMLLAAGPAAIGLLLLITGSASNHAWFVRLIGLLAIGKGVFIYLNPNNKWGEISEAFLKTVTSQTYRFIGIIFIILGTALFSWIR
jgi:hypothetical protein